MLQVVYMANKKYLHENEKVEIKPVIKQDIPAPGVCNL
jgi:hypothetical protein